MADRARSSNEAEAALRKGRAEALPRDATTAKETPGAAGDRVSRKTSRPARNRRVATPTDPNDRRPIGSERNLSLSGRTAPSDTHRAIPCAHAYP
jgi:hypothetical protein